MDSVFSAQAYFDTLDTAEYLRESGLTLRDVESLVLSLAEEHAAVTGQASVDDGPYEPLTWRTGAHLVVQWMWVLGR